MRITVTLADTEAIIRRRKEECGETFEQAINGAIRANALPRPLMRRLGFKTHDMGPPRIDIAKAVQVSAEMENHHVPYSLRYERRVLPSSE